MESLPRGDCNEEDLDATQGVQPSDSQVSRSGDPETTPNDADGPHDESQESQLTHIRQLAPAFCCAASCHFGGSPRLLHEAYELQDELGNGASSTVYSAIESSTGEVRAVKLMYRLSPEDESPDAAIEDAFQAEVSVLRSVNHPNLVRLYDVFESPQSFALAMEFCPGGNIFDFFKQDEHMAESAVMLAMRQVCSALAHLHGMSICHSDVKPENILVSGLRSPGHPFLKLADFGVAGFLAGKPLAIGISPYSAPEVADDVPHTDSGDVWALGMVIFVLLSGVDPNTIRTSIVAGSMPQLPPEYVAASDCLSWCLEVDPASRCPAQAALAHDWLTEALPKETPPEVAEGLQALLQFCTCTELQRVVAQVVAYAMPAEAIVDLVAAFETLDADVDGALSLYELRDALHRLDPASDLSDEMCAALLVDESKALHFNMFVAASLGSKRRFETEALRRTFCAIDLCGTGFITKPHLRMLLQEGLSHDELGKESAELVLERLDVTDECKLDFEGFCILLRVLGDNEDAREACGPAAAAAAVSTSVVTPVGAEGIAGTEGKDVPGDR